MKAHSSRPKPGPSGRLRAKRRSLLFSCAIGSALALAGHGEQAKAQAFQANPTTVAGGVVYDRAIPGIETVTIDTDSAIIDWAPIVGGNPIPFLPAGNVATFQNGVDNGDFVVLNRIVAQDPVRFDGTVLGRLQGAGVGTPGGTILFSSPGGIIVGANALFDVGSLVLTTLNVVEDSPGDFITPSGGFEFNGGDDFPNAAIVTEAGSQILATTENSYIALVAPAIVHGGSVSVNGSAAYVAGEALEFTVSQGLFDIVVTTGSDNPTPITHAASASTGGPASTGGADNHAVYMVAVPKNQAIQMLLEGSVGFQPAVSASVENGVIILSSGFGVSGTTIQDIAPSTLDADVVINGGDFTSDVNGRATTEFRATAQNSDLTFAGDLNIRGGSVAALGATGGFDTSVGGELTITAAAAAEPDGIGGEAAVFADPGSSVTVTGDALVDASGLGVIDGLGTVGNGTGGTARVTADNGVIAFGGNVELRATGEGAEDVSAPDLGGFGQGGSIQLTADNGSVTIAGDLLADATGIGSASNGSLPAAGMPGFGGTVLIRAANGGAVTVTGASAVRAQGVGGVVEGGAATGGIGLGGDVDVEADDGDVDLGASSQFDATGFGGAGPVGGVGSGGTVTVSALAGGIALGATAAFQALGTGGDGFVVPGGSGGAGTGGIVELRARGGSGGSLIGGGDVNIITQGTGGNGGDSDGLVAAGGGADGSGGNATVVAETGDGSLQLGNVLVQANGDGGSGGFGSGSFQPGPAGAGDGGNVTVGTETGSAGPGLAADASFADLDAEAFGFGGNGALGGAGTGGQIDLLAAAGTWIDITGPGAMSADGIGGAGLSLGGQGGAGTGGRVRIDALGDVSLADFAISANGIGSPGFGAGGAGQGGLVAISADGADLDLNGVLFVLALGSGGEANDPAAAGADAVGGNIRIRSGNGGAIDVAVATVLTAAGSGGTAVPGADSQGGQGQGGSIDVLATGGTVALGANVALDVSGGGGEGPVGGTGRGGIVRIEAQAGAVDLGPAPAIVAGGIGADSNADLGSGGDGFGGTVGIRALAGTAPSLVSSGALFVVAEGTGGRGGDRGAAAAALPMGSGGAGAGGDVTILAEAANGALSIAAGIQASADGFGGGGGTGGTGLGGNGGDADGGTIIVGTEIGSGALGSAGSAQLGTIQLGANATGGSGGAGGTGGVGGNANAGAIRVQAERAPVGIGSATLRADGLGGAGGGGAGTGAGGDILFALDGSSGSDALPPAGGSDLIDAGSITGSAGGSGTSPTGNSAGRWRFDIRDGNMAVGDVNLVAQAAGSPPSAQASTIDLVDGSLDIAGTGTFDTDGDILLSATGTGRMTGGDITFRGSRFEASHAGRAAADASVDVDSLLVQVDGDFVANAGVRIIADALVALEAGGNAIVAGVVAAPEIRIRSVDIDIASGGSVGDAGTQRTTLLVVPAAGEPFAEQVLLGGTNEGPGYTLTDAEANRITSATLEVEAPATGTALNRPADVLVANLALDAARVGRFEIDTSGIVQVGGNLLLANAGGDDGIEVAAGQRVEIVTPSGSIRVRDAGGLPVGSLDLVSRNIWSASQRLIVQLRADPDFVGRDDDLLVNDGPVEPRGYIEGGDVRLFAGDTLFVQNSGTLGLFAGITVLENTLAVIPTGVAPLQVLAFGRRINADGSYVTNDRFFGEVDFQQGPAGAGYTDASELNTCNINTGICRVRDPDVRNPGGSDIIEDPVDGPDFFNEPPGADDELVDTSFADDPLIEEPVTSGADSILWDCDRDDDDDCDGDDRDE